MRRALASIAVVAAGCSGNPPYDCHFELSRALRVQSFTACFDSVTTSGACTEAVKEGADSCRWTSTMTGDVGSRCRVEVRVGGTSCATTAELRASSNCDGPKATFVYVDGSPSLRCYETQ